MKTPLQGIREVDGAQWRGVLDALRTAVLQGRSRALLRLLEEASAPGEEAQRELAAFPRNSCAALSEETGLSPERCRAGRGCPVEKECPFPGRLAASSLGRSVALLAHRGVLPLSPGPEKTVSGLRGDLARLLDDHPLLRDNPPPRSRASLAILDLALTRGGLLGATGPFLTAQEMEHVAAFLPPGSGRIKPDLAPVEAWVRRAASAEAALVEFVRG